MATTGRGSPQGMRLFEASVESPDLRDMIKSLEVNTTDTVRAVLEFVRKDVLYYLKSYTNVVKPPRYQRKWMLDANQRRVKVTGTEGWRHAHPGGWADVTDDLRKKYYTRLEFVDGAWKLTIGNSSDHAIYVEAMDGYFVVHGVMAPGGPVARAIRRALISLGVKWKVTGALGSVSNMGESSMNVGPRSGEPPLPVADFTEEL